MSKASVILLDIETSPIIGYSWSQFDTNILKVIENSKILSVAWKELGEDNLVCKTISDYKTYTPGKVDDRLLVEEVWDVLDKADIVIAHYGDAFDLKKLNSRFVWHGLKAPSAYKTVDTKKVASKYFKFDSNSLNNLGSYLNLGQKVENGGFDLWVRCLDGDKEAWEMMRRYNAQDVILLEKVYMTLRPYMETHPNLNAIVNAPKDDTACPTCLSHDVTRRGFSITRTGRRQRYQCGSCGSWSSGAFSKIGVLSTDSDYASVGTEE